MVSKNRAQRIADRIYEEISEMLIFDIQDPRLSGVSVTDVVVDRELAFADIYVSSVQGSESAEDILSGFQRASGFLRSELARRIDLRTFPQIRFHWDQTPERAEKIEKLLDSLSQESQLTSEDDLLENE
jgi:ribosome-binding factor A